MGGGGTKPWKLRGLSSFVTQQRTDFHNNLSQDTLWGKTQTHTLFENLGKFQFEKNGTFEFSPAITFVEFFEGFTSNLLEIYSDRCKASKTKYAVIHQKK